MDRCVKCGSDFVEVEKEVGFGWRTVADKYTCLECLHVEYENERSEDDFDNS